jgi:putative long chain acyl-CoA synthase
MGLLPKTLTRPVARFGAAAQNALEIARFGGLDTEQQPSPYEVVCERRISKLRRYYPGEAAADAPPVLLIPPMMLAAEIYDVSPQTSAVTTLKEHGADPWVVDFGAPEHEEGGLERNLADHVLAISEAIDTVRELTGSDVHLAGYSQGGMFCYQVAAYRRSEGLASLLTFGSPVDTQAGMPFGVPEGLGGTLTGLLAERVFHDTALPAWVSRTGFRLLDPAKAVRNQIDFLRQLHDREALLPREGQRRFLDADGWVAWPGPAMADFLKQFVAHNRMLLGGFVVEDRLVTLADIETPIMSVVGSVDSIAPAPGVRAIRQAAPLAEVYELTLPAGHFGLVVGASANELTWPTAAAWARWQSGVGEFPERLAAIAIQDSTELGPAVVNRVGYGFDLLGGVGAGIARSVSTATRGVAQGVRGFTRDAAGQLPRLARLGQIHADSQISLGLLLEERRRRGGDDEVFFLFGDRAHTIRDMNERVDNVVLGLISIGVRQGEAVGVLMAARPTALTVTAALSRLGAVAVMLRPDGDLAREADLGEIKRVIADPERAPLAVERLTHLPAYVLGGGGGHRKLAVGAVDMEQIDPGLVELPAWYEPNPGRGADTAFVLFTGEGAQTRLNRVSNRRWALSAFGTASAAALTSEDTVYCVTPLYHASGLMMSIGGAVAGGARLAMTASFEPETFWQEARRYGVTVASYTWTMLHELTYAPEQPGESHHGVRLFMGSGMPNGLWRRVQTRFAPARVLEFYAATEASAILVNVNGAKVGSMGRQLPGSGEVRLAAFDVLSGEYKLGPDGFARPCGAGEVGMMLARTRASKQYSSTVLRGVFKRGDIWVQTGDLFRRDADGDYWRVDALTDVVHAEQGPCFTGPIRDSLGTLPAVDLAVAYGLQTALSAQEVAVAALTVAPGATLTARELGAAFGWLPFHQRPLIARVVDRIPVTTWYRPLTAPLRAQGLPVSTKSHPSWYLDLEDETYKPFTAAARKRLAGVAADV